MIWTPCRPKRFVHCPSGSSVRCESTTMSTQFLIARARTRAPPAGERFCARDRGGSPIGAEAQQRPTRPETVSASRPSQRGTGIVRCCVADCWAAKDRHVAANASSAGTGGGRSWSTEATQSSSMPPSMSAPTGSWWRKPCWSTHCTPGAKMSAPAVPRSAQTFNVRSSAPGIPRGRDIEGSSETTRPLEQRTRTAAVSSTSSPG